VIYIALAALVVADLGYLAPSTSGVGYLIVLAGFPVYLLWRRGARARASGSDRPRHP
jgi:APA family basic amino acid/polyamine antiporter